MATTMVSNSLFVELKARKAKFGFNFGHIRLDVVVPLAAFIQAIETEFGKDTKYVFEETGYNEPILKLYTDNEEVANFIRNYAP